MWDNALKTSLPQPIAGRERQTDTAHTHTLANTTPAVWGQSKQWLTGLGLGARAKWPPPSHKGDFLWQTGLAVRHLRTLRCARRDYVLTAARDDTHSQHCTTGLGGRVSTGRRTWPSAKWPPTFTKGDCGASLGWLMDTVYQAARAALN